MTFIGLMIVGALLFTAVPLRAAAASIEMDGRIRPWPENPRYWEYDGKPILLVGGTDEDNLFNDPDLFAANMAIYEEIGGNYIRATLSWRDEGNVPPYAPDENGRYDLNRFNPEFWDRLEASIRRAQELGVIVQIEVWATFDYYGDRWDRNPWNPKNNVNYTTEDTRLVVEWNEQPFRRVQPFFFSVPEENDDRILLAYQEAFVRKVLDASLPYPNVLYCLDNETRAPEAWALYWGRFIGEEARQRGVTAHVTEMWDVWDLRLDDHRRTWGHPDVFTFTEVSQNNWNSGQTHFDRLMWFRETLESSAGGPRPMNNVKVYGAPTTRAPAETALNLERWWGNLFAGCASTRFHRPPSGLGLSEPAQRAIRGAVAFFGAFDVFRSEPRPDLLAERDEHEAYLLATDSGSYALYFPTGGSVRLDVGGEASSATARWFDPNRVEFRKPERLSIEEGSVELTTPDTAQPWLAIVQAE